MSDLKGLRVVFVEPRHPGNVGAVARVMKNFGAERLRLVRPPALGEEARRMAMHGRDVLESAQSFDSFEEATADIGFLVGTSAIDTANEKRFVRISTGPEEAAARVSGNLDDSALILGREDFGLRNEELGACDLLVTIPTNPDYPVLNIAQAAGILLYELYLLRGEGIERPIASPEEKKTLFDAFDELLAETNYPRHKRERTTVMFRRMLGRAVPSKWEFHALMGVIARASKTIRRERARAPTRKAPKAGRRGSTRASRPRRTRPSSSSRGGSGASSRRRAGR